MNEATQKARDLIFADIEEQLSQLCGTRDEGLRVLAYTIRGMMDAVDGTPAGDTSIAGEYEADYLRGREVGGWTPCDPGCEGYCMRESDKYGLSIERCDECKRFETDDEACLKAYEHFGLIFGVDGDENGMLCDIVDATHGRSRAWWIASALLNQVNSVARES